MFLATSLTYYKQKQIREAMVAQAESKEVSVMYGPDSFGKRPDTLTYEDDVLELAKRKATSFHCSEELWHNPLSIRTGMSRAELNELRTGWDLILDIDCPDWEFSKLTTYMFIKALQDHGMTSISVKFSGNKGFHIAVPFEAFPETIPFEGQNRLVKDLFPEGPRQIATYLLSFITKNYVDLKGDQVTFANKKTFSIDQLQNIAKQSSQSLFPEYKIKKEIYLCGHCGHTSKPQGNPEFIRCERCDKPVAPQLQEPKEKQDAFFNFAAVIDVDTVLISSRHLYRMPFSLHEKSGLISLPIPLENVLRFRKEWANPQRANFQVLFLDRSKATKNEGLTLLREAFDFNYKPEDEYKSIELKEIEIPEHAIEEEYFPLPIQMILKGMEDGRKRAIFVLINFLGCCGWSYDQIEQRVYAWNKENVEQLREQYLKGQLTAFKKKPKPILPPKTTNKDYYTFLTQEQRQKFARTNLVNLAKKTKELKEKELKKQKRQKKAQNKKKEQNKENNKEKKPN